ncbi:RHS repeat-associated core domain-containing protein [Cellulomonas sp. 73-145]|uniref:RHS repeat-associated core domain-containing protein n=1 Tax=Cellulomonas sp. 73-145 TaxID=1895739 RepID=UPI0025B8DFE5|nr:RHS repeat-associated core domain-containing protein [Cellulomonas sp. 73-145]
MTLTLTRGPGSVHLVATASGAGSEQGLTEIVSREGGVVGSCASSTCAADVPESTRVQVFRARHGALFSKTVTVQPARGAATKRAGAAKSRVSAQTQAPAAVAAATVTDPSIHDVSTATMNGWTVSVGMQETTPTADQTWTQLNGNSYDLHHFWATASFSGSLDPGRQYAIDFVDETTGTVFASCSLPADSCLGELMPWYSGAQHPVSAVVVSTKTDGSDQVQHAQVGYTGWYAASVSLYYAQWNPNFYAGDGEPLTIEARDSADIPMDGQYAIYVEDVTTGTTLAKCMVNPCNVDATYYTGLHSFRTWLADANDPTTHVVAYTTPLPIPRAAWSAYGVGEVQDPVGSTVMIEGWVNQDVGLTNGNYFQYVMDLTTNTVVKRCDTGDACDVVIPLNGHFYGNRVAGPAGPYDDVQAVSDHGMYFSTDGPAQSLPLSGGGARWETSGGINPSEKCTQACAADPVNVVTGEYWKTTADLTASPLVSMRRAYASSLASQDGPFGYGSSWNWGVHLEMGPGATGTSLADTGQIIVVQENGSFVSYVRDAHGNLQTAQRVHATLTANSDGTFRFARTDGTAFTFAADGTLTSVQDRNGNTATVTTSNGNPTRIQDNHGGTLTLTWDANHLTSASDQTGRQVTYTYDANGDLTTATDPTGAATTYTYADHRATTITDPAGGTVTNTYDTSERVSSQTDAVGRQTTFGYTGDPGSGQTTETDPTGTVTTYAYEQGEVTSRTTAVGTPQAATTTSTYWAGQLTATTDALGHTTSYINDSNGNHTSTTDPLSRVTNATYNQFNEPLTVTDPAGETTTFVYDSHGNLQSKTDPTGAVTAFTVNSDGTVATATDATGNVTRYGYDAHGYLASTADANGAVTTAVFDALGRQVSVTDPRGNVTGADPTQYTSTIAYDPAGRPTSATDPYGSGTSMGYDAVGNVTSSTDQLGQVTKFTYDAAGQRLSATDPTGAATKWSYDKAGRVASITAPDGGVSSYSYDAAGNRTSTTDPDGRVTTSTFDLTGKVTSTTTPSGATTSYTYDAAGQVTKVVDPNSHATTTTYDQAGRPVTVTDALGRAVSTTYDKAGRTTQVTRADGTKLAWGYDAAGRQTSYTDAAGAVTKYAYDAAGRLKTATDTARRVTGYAYDPAGNQTVVTYPDGGTATSTYDRLGRSTGTTYSGTTPATTRAYDAASRVTTATSGSSSTTYAYDGAGRPTTVTTDGATVGYAWTAGGRLATLTYPGGNTVGYSHDPAGQLTKVSDWAGGDYQYTWTKDGQVETLTYPNGIATHHTYDTAGQATALTSDNSAGTQLLKLAYAYDDAGQLTSQTADRSTGPRAPPTTPTTTSTYTWDPLGQLGQVTGAEAGAYGFTTTGQLTQLPDGTSLTYDTAGQVSTRTAAAGSDGTPGQVTSYTYNSLGQRTGATVGDKATAYAYDQTGKLTSLTDPTGATSTYTYEASGLRSTATTSAGAQRFVWDPTAAVPELLTDGTHQYVYGVGSTPIAQVNADNSVDYLHTDQTGSVRTVTDHSGNVVADSDYSPYGIPLDVNGAPISAITPFGYAGQYTDPTGLLYLRARYYDPTTSQFLTIDPLVAATHLPYAYTPGNPVQLTDPLGLDWWGNSSDAMAGSGLNGGTQDGANSCTAGYSWGAVTGVAANTILNVAHGAVSIAKTVARVGVSAVAVAPYAVYYVTYRTQGSLGTRPPSWANSAATWLENRMLDADQALDGVKRRLGAKEPDNDEGGNGGILPIHISGVDKDPGDPLHTYLPGVDPDGTREVGPSDYGWGAGWGDRSGVPNI